MIYEYTHTPTDHITQCMISLVGECSLLCLVLVCRHPHIKNCVERFVFPLHSQMFHNDNFTWMWNVKCVWVWRWSTFVSCLLCFISFLLKNHNMLLMELSLWGPCVMLKKHIFAIPSHRHQTSCLTVLPHRLSCSPCQKVRVGVNESYTCLPQVMCSGFERFWLLRQGRHKIWALGP